MDARLNPEAPPSPEHVAIHRKDYRPPDWWVPDVALDFALDGEKSRVRSTLTVTRNGEHDRPLRLAGDELTPLSVTVDGGEARWRMDGDALVIDIAGDSATVETEVELNPSANTHLMGLYASGGNLCTQCESEGFRRIAFHPDRPDVLSRYRVRMSADKARYPVLLANGNLVESGDGEGGTHWAVWEDPFPKPSYLFALVAADLAANRDTFVPMSGRTVDLAIYVRPDDLPRTAHAMASLKAAMKWDEEVYGREYDLDLFNIVAVDDFNFGAMENKGLNIFNSRYVLADQDSATDGDFDNVAGVVAHEYFHNWSGDRVTCRDWFQLSLKEGFTVFRDQCFSADMGSEAVKRIDDVRLLRAAQFPEDSGPLAHPIRPESYVEITNFYTATVYNKGAEVIRMMRTILGDEAFRRGSDLYFDRHDGTAATCEDFVKAMEDASSVDLGQFRLWYSQAGTPKVTARIDHDAAAGKAVLHLTQAIPDTPGQTGKSPMVLPLRVGLIGADSGNAIGEERLVLLDTPEASVKFDAPERPMLSINRGFSAPVILDVAREAGDLERLAAVDPDPFARYEAVQELMMRVLVAGAQGQPLDPAPVIEAVRGTLASNALDPAFKGEALSLPSESLIGDRMEQVDPDAIHASRRALAHAIGSALASELKDAQAARADGADLSPTAKGVRRLRSVALGLIAAGNAADGAALAKAQYDAATTMTERQGALAVLASLDAPERATAFDDFYARYADNTLVLDKWFALQAGMAQREDTLDVVEALAKHPDFTLRNPNRWRALVANFAANQWVFHHASGRGYRFLADRIIEIDSANPQVAARQVPALGRWRRMEPGRAALMRAELERIVATPGLSKDTFEQASKSLG
ncbi:aminopeptidase N [Sphingomonas sp. LY160]|uniref:aminopeptidase N n=1 Tax=Sphingomonas sp. LY160 TaxID=3095342 RepID=UPI002ADEAB65|nr:aminopeptidase N [Sphingomonas sp. LY160]MEA1072150.1 aminopeptidase N [Sphingomonas sp. LY160]